MTLLAAKLSAALCTLAAAAVFAMLPHPARAATPCPKTCVRFESIVHAAGVPPALKQAVEALEFDGNRLAAAAQPAVASIAKELKAQPPKSVLAVSVRADDGLTPAAAKGQAAARAKALKEALTRAGVPARQLKISAGPSPAG